MGPLPTMSCTYAVELHHMVQSFLGRGTSIALVSRLPRERLPQSQTHSLSSGGETLCPKHTTANAQLSNVKHNYENEKTDVYMDDYDNFVEPNVLPFQKVYLHNSDNSGYLLQKSRVTLDTEPV